MESNCERSPESSSEVENSSQCLNISPTPSPNDNFMTKRSEQYSMLSHEELVSRLINANAKIEELEATRPLHSLTLEKSSFQDILHLNDSKCGTEETQTDSNAYCAEDLTDSDSQSRPTFAYLSKNASSIISSPDGTQLLIQELQAKLRDCGIGDQYRMENERDDEFVVAYECRGDFPNCDEDLSLAENSDASSPRKRKQRFLEIGDDDSSSDDNDDELAEFPLIPSPVLNTPPYEYIFLTKENEARVRIFLNPKLNQVFQEELTKLQKSEEHEQLLEERKSQPHNAQTNHMDINNQNHLANCSSLDEVKNTFSSSNVIHCFDPSDVDLELKKVFMEKPPITHKIIRRKSRRERGSSVPAVDSYYGTGDLNKVGHASYFIPALTDSERKAIGWRSQYHYGHWKYSTLHVPTNRTNQISLHPHPHVESSSIKSKQNHPHHHESDLPQPFLIDSEANSILESPTSTPFPSKDPQDEDTLSFITLSGSTHDASQSCHIIPDKSALKRILHWILPCVKTKAVKSDSSIHHSSDSGNNNEELCNDDDDDKNEMSTDIYHINDDNEIGTADADTLLETLVEPSDKLHSPTSHFQISFAVGTKSGQLHHSQQQYRLFQGNQSQHSTRSSNDEDNESHHNHHKHHHHHGFLHWKHILTHGSRSDDSMSVVGGDVMCESNPGINVVKVNEVDVAVDEVVGTMREDLFKLKKETLSTTTKNTSIIDNNDDDDDSDEISSSEDQIVGEGKRSHGKKLKFCKAYTKLLTLKDLGYESDDEIISRAHVKGQKIANTETDSDDVTNLSQEGNHEKKCSSNTGKLRRTSKKLNRNRVRGSKAGNHQIMKSGKYNEANQHGSASDVGGSGGEDEDFSSGYPFSSMTVSNEDQNSFTTTHFCDDLESSSQLSTCSQDYVETRFLDPKDLLTPRYQELQGQTSNSLPFVYEFDVHGNLVEGFNDESINYDENIIQWMDQNFPQEIEEELELMNSSLDAVLIKSLLSKGNSKSAGSLVVKHDENDDDDGIPEKVNGQHRIITLNQISLENHIDVVNENLK